MATVRIYKTKLRITVFCWFSDRRICTILLVISAIYSGLNSSGGVESKAAEIPTTATARGYSGSSGSNRRRCLPVSHDVLWQRLNSKMSIFANNLPTDKSLNDSSDHLSVDVQRHRHPQRRSHLRSQRMVSADYVADLDDILEVSLESENNSFVNSSDDVSGHIDDTALKKSDMGQRRRERVKKKRKVVTSRTIERMLRKTSWHCRLERQWKKMADGVFPPYVQTGRCRQKTCMLGMYECRPRRYRIKILQRLDGDCSPLPGLGTYTEYEESWALSDFKVVVGCECSRLRATGTYWIAPHGVSRDAT